MIGTALAAPRRGDGTSKTNPWSLAPSAAPRRITSSQVSHDPHGVGPPAQLVSVPPSVACDPVSSPPAKKQRGRAAPEPVEDARRS